MNAASVSSFVQSLRQSGIPIEDDAQRLAVFASDASGRCGVAPVALARPRNGAHVRQIVQQAHTLGVPLMPISSGHGPRRRGDTISDTPCVIIDLSGLTQMMHIDGKDAIALVEAGVTFPAFAKALAPHGLRPYQPLMPRASKSVLAAFLDREPMTVPGRQWDSADPLSCLDIVFGNGERFRTGGAALPVELEESLALGNRHIYGVGPAHLDFARVVMGSQGALGIVTWASIFCQRIPASELPLFASSDKPEPLIDLLYRLLRRRIDGQIFIVNNVQLALMLAKDGPHYTQLKASLPRWVAYFELTAPPYFPEESIAYQRALADDDAAKLGLKLVKQLGGEMATAVAQAQQSYPEVPPSQALDLTESEAFCLSRLDRAPDHITKVAALNAEAECAVYLQPMNHGVNAHCQFTFLAPTGFAVDLDAESRRAAVVLADTGGFLSRPHYPWADIPFQRDPGAGSLISIAKDLFDPKHILKPGAASLGQAK